MQLKSNEKIEINKIYVNFNEKIKRAQHVPHIHMLKIQ